MTVFQKATFKAEKPKTMTHEKGQQELSKKSKTGMFVREFRKLSDTGPQILASQARRIKKNIFSSSLLYTYKPVV